MTSKRLKTRTVVTTTDMQICERYPVMHRKVYQLFIRCSSRKLQRRQLRDDAVSREESDLMSLVTVVEHNKTSVKRQ